MEGSQLQNTGKEYDQRSDENLDKEVQRRHEQRTKCDAAKKDFKDEGKSCKVLHERSNVQAQVRAACGASCWSEVLEAVCS